jgi:hypothetical protein
MKRSIFAGISMLVVAIASPLSANATSQTTPSNLANVVKISLLIGLHRRLPLMLLKSIESLQVWRNLLLIFENLALTFPTSAW